MITNKSELKYFLKRDALALVGNRAKPKLVGDDVWKFQISLRKLEYYTYKKSRNKLYVLLYLLKKLKYRRLSFKLGFSLPLNVFEEGLSVAHFGTIVVSSNSKIGKNCRIHEGVTIGSTNGSEKAPIIGNNVFIGSGAKIIGDITIADNVAIGANAVVIKSITEEGTYAGIPAKKISDNNSRLNLRKELFM